MLYRCNVFFFLTQIRKNRCDSYENEDHVFFSNISIVAISAGFPVAVNTPVPPSQEGFQQFRAI